MQYEVLELPNNFLAHTGSLLPDNQDGTYVYSTNHFTLTQERGAERHIDGATHPAKGIPTPQAIFALNQVKSLLKESINHPIPLLLTFLLNRNKLLNSFNNIIHKLFYPYLVTREYLVPSAKAVHSFLYEFLQELGIDEPTAELTAYYVAQFPEYDDIYRYIFQDTIAAMDMQMMEALPHMDLQYLQSVIKQRGTHVVSGKINKVLKLLNILLYVPKYKKAFTKHVHHLLHALPDEADIYWMAHREDYLFGGKTYEERVKGLVIPVMYKI